MDTAETPKRREGVGGTEGEHTPKEAAEEVPGATMSVVAHPARCQCDIIAPGWGDEVSALIAFLPSPTSFLTSVHWQPLADELMPSPAELNTLGDPYRPYRSVAAWYCWRAAE